MKKSLIALVCLLGLASCGEPTQKMTPEEVTQTVYRIVDEYDTPRPKITINDNRLWFVEESLAETVCHPNGLVCEIAFRTCSLYNHSIEELAVHEAAHVVVAYKHKVFDHGIEWKEIMREQGYRDANEQLHNTKCR